MLDVRGVCFLHFLNFIYKMFDPMLGSGIGIPCYRREESGIGVPSNRRGFISVRTIRFIGGYVNNLSP